MGAELRSGSDRSLDDAALEKFRDEILGDLASGRLVLPMLPEITLRTNDMAGDPAASLKELADLIVTDTLLSAQLIKVSNSPLYAGIHSFDTVPRAVSRLGFTVVRNLVSSLAVQQMFKASSLRLEQQLRSLWQYSVDVAALCHMLASGQGGIPEDEAMLAGLIHNIGVLPVLVKAEENKDLSSDPAKLDRLVHNLSSPIGVAVLESWNFPESLVEVVAEYRDYSRDSINGPDLVDVVQVASLQSNFNAHHGMSAEELAAIPAFRKLGIQTDVQVEELGEDSEAYTEALALFS